MEGIDLTYTQFPYVILPQIELLGCLWTSKFLQWQAGNQPTAKVSQIYTANEEYLMQAPECNTGVYCIYLHVWGCEVKIKHFELWGTGVILSSQVPQRCASPCHTGTQ